MASPQLENGFTRISNELMDAFSKSAPCDMSKVIFTILRNTYGWNKKEAQISLKFFEKSTGIASRNIPRILKILENKNIVTILKLGSSGNVYSLNKDFDKWSLKSETLKSETLEVETLETLEVETTETLEVETTLVIKKSEEPLSINGDDLKKPPKDILKTIKDNTPSQKKLKKVKKTVEQKLDDSVNGWKCWIDANIRSRKVNPVPIGASLGIAKRIAAGFKTAKELEDVMYCYLGDEDNFLSNAGHPIKMLEGRIEKYRNEIVRQAKEDAIEEKEYAEARREQEIDNAILEKGTPARKAKIAAEMEARGNSPEYKVFKDKMLATLEGGKDE